MTQRTLGRGAGPLALLLTITLALAGCQGSGPAPTGSASGEPSPSGSRSPGGPDGPVEPEELAFGDHPMVQPCALMPPEAVERVVGRLGPGTTWDQEYLDRGLTRAEVVDETDTLTRAVRTLCVYYLDSESSPSLQLEVEQYRNERDARARIQHDTYLGSPAYAEEMRRLAADPETAWIADLGEGNDRMGGRPVAGEPGLLYVPGYARWERQQDNLVLTLSYREGVVFDPEPLTPEQYRQQLPWAKALLARAARSVGTVSTRPAATVPEKDAEAAPGVPFLEPCEVLDSELFAAIHGRADSEPIRAGSLPLRPRGELRRSYTKSLLQRCERWSPAPKASRFAQLELRTTTSPDLGIRTLDRALALTYYDREQWDEITAGRMQAGGLLKRVVEETGADVAYIFDHRDDGERPGQRTALLYLVVGPYVAELSATRGPSRAVTDETFTRVAPLLVERIRTLAELPEE